jgi:plasmid stabilization system protein ParE
MSRPKEVIFSPEAEAQIIALYEYLAANTSPTIAEGYISAIVERCEVPVRRRPSCGDGRDDGEVRLKDQSKCGLLDWLLLQGLVRGHHPWQGAPPLVAR